jgi:putative Holliday junction resolvase
VLGIDLGSKRIGLAISDSEGRLAFPAGVIESEGRKRDLAALRTLIREREIGRAVVGVPLHMSGRRGPEAEKAIRFAGDLAHTAGIPVDTLDERWTSVEAERILRSTHSGTRAIKARKGAVDEMAAAILLRTYLDLSRAQADRLPIESEPSEPEPSGSDPCELEARLVDDDGLQDDHD